jgi:hypothetical protein
MGALGFKSMAGGDDIVEDERLARLLVDWWGRVRNRRAGKLREPFGMLVDTMKRAQFSIYQQHIGL